MQGLGSGAISLHGTPEQRERYLTKVARGEAISAFALSEPDAGSDVAAMACAAREDGTDYVLDGEKTWISNGGIADFYVVFARTGEAPGSRGISAFIVETVLARAIEFLGQIDIALLRAKAASTCDAFRREDDNAVQRIAEESPRCDFIRYGWR